MNIELIDNLQKLYNIELKIAELIKAEGFRFSINKLTADLGEYYAAKVLSSRKNIFDSITPEKNSNAKYDMLGRLSEDSTLNEYFKERNIRIEIKTRRNQEGVKYLGNIHPENFELLCMVDLPENYQPNKIYLVTNETVNQFIDKKYNRLIFKESMAFMTL